MDGLIMKYFVLKPSGDNEYAMASRRAIKMYAKTIEKTNGKLATELRDWMLKEDSAVIDSRLENPPKRV